MRTIKQTRCCWSALYYCPLLCLPDHPATEDNMRILYQNHKGRIKYPQKLQLLYGVHRVYASCFRQASLQWEEFTLVNNIWQGYKGNLSVIGLGPGFSSPRSGFKSSKPFWWWCFFNHSLSNPIKVSIGGGELIRSGDGFNYMVKAPLFLNVHHIFKKGRALIFNFLTQPPCGCP